jgi:ferric-dicitrate binding protein FerR (iron transport regulator)
MERIQYLLRQYLNAAITEEEAQELTHLLKDEAFSGDIHTAMEGMIMAHIEGKEPAVRRGVRPMRRIWMAAAVLLLLVGGAWLWQRSGVSREVAVGRTLAVAHDALPGSSKAILTLADGKKVRLDSATGVIGHQGGEELVSRNEQLLYRAAGGPDADGGFNILTTPRGGQYQLVLPDGTKVWLNADSYLRYPVHFSGDKREVELKGEAYFEVAANAAAPFSVQVLRDGKDPMGVDVLGTHFNIMDYSDEPVIRTTLLEGAVRVHKGGERVVLRPGQEARLDEHDRLAVVTGDVDEAVAWKNGMFKFDGATIGQVMRQISRWYDLDVEYVNGMPKDVFQGEIYRNVNVSQILKILEASGVHFSVEGRKLLVK